ncbi:cytochrome aa3 quinol oxidase subunit IV [Gracilibacillus massiliensis]|uniref:cytochrome aa3 quinol oxidase subunit IV n=1 Tax=Gracilibacillus massiliensis TaxID=1564956 RepID=UPI00071D9379|nr:cytochrome aa3 quinol oxidase subunit IV [Gracilibacillus massiliensis]
MSAHTSRFPWNLLVGFVLSIALTLLAVFVAFNTNFSKSIILGIIGTLAIFQALIQLFMFMHVTEGKEGIINVVNMIYSVFLALVIVFGSIWVLTSGHASMH